MYKMILVYVIYDDAVKELYIGMTNNIERRLSEHKRGQSKYTKKFKNIRLIYKEEYPNYKEARKREKYLKTGYGREFLKNLV